MNTRILILSLMWIPMTIWGQPKARQQQQQNNRKTLKEMTVRSQISFPVSPEMKPDVVWRRDIYREIHLNNEPNAGLYFPTEPQGSQMNLFTYLFKLMMTGQIKAYEYRLTGDENFEDSARIKPLQFLDNYHIYYEKLDGRIRLDNSDIPSKEVTSYYIKECAYYDQRTATFHTRVTALCPILKRQDEFGDTLTPYPLFWVKYDDIAPYLAKQTMMTSNLNNAAVMSMDDYFTLNMYKGKIYKTTNMLGKTLTQYCADSTKICAEQKKIEKEISDFEAHLWGDHSTENDTIKDTKAYKEETKKYRKSRKSLRTPAPRKLKRMHSESTADSPRARISARRERH